jgi:hypothetical protein
VPRPRSFTREAVTECTRAGRVDNPTDPALPCTPHAAGGLAASSLQARVAAAREQLLGVRTDAEALAATGVGHVAVPLAPLKPPCCCRTHATTRGAVISDEVQALLTVSVADLMARCRRSGSAHALSSTPSSLWRPPMLGRTGCALSATGFS